MKKFIMYIILLGLAAIVIVAAEQVFLRIMDSKVTELKNNYDIVENETSELKLKISSLLARNKLYEIAQQNKYFEPKENTDVIYLKNND